MKMIKRVTIISRLLLSANYEVRVKFFVTSYFRSPVLNDVLVTLVDDLTHATSPRSYDDISS